MTVSVKPLMIQVGGLAGHEVRITLDLGDDGDQPEYDLDRDQARFLVHQLQVELMQMLKPSVEHINSSGR